MSALQVVMLVGLFVVGAVVGSFLNVCIWRLPRGLAVNQPRRSFCPHCGTSILWRDNIPIISFLALGRRCRACGEPISWRYPAVEGITGLLFALIYFRQGVQAGTGPGQVATMLLVTALLIVASGIDVDWLIIPDEISLFGIAGGLAAGLLLPGLHVGAESFHTFAAPLAGAHLTGLISSLIGTLAGGGIVVVCALVGYLIFRKEAMGIGDAKLLALVGAFFGWKVAVVTFFLSPFIGLLYGVPVLLSSGQHVMPYGPFLSIGAALAIVFRATLCAWLLEPVTDLFHLLLG